MNNKDNFRSWFCVLNNPQNLFGDIEPLDMVHKAIEIWIDNKPQRTCAINYEIGDTGTPHMHMVLEDPAKVRFSALQKLYKGIHIEPTKGTKEQAEDYINKRGKFEEKNHTVIVPAVYHGEIKANKGKRNDLDLIQELIEQGKTPAEIMDISIHFRQYSKIIREAFFRFRTKNAPIEREITVIWHVGNSGCGKTHSYIELCEKYGIENVYLLTDYENGGFDNYNAESVLVMDEFKGNLKFSALLTYLDKYPVQLHCRYTNSYALWNEVHITSVYPPELAYNFMVDEHVRNTDKLEQLLRRISYIVYHYKENDTYKTFSLPISQYKDYEDLKSLAYSKDKDGFYPMKDEQLKNNPFC